MYVFFLQRLNIFCNNIFEVYDVLTMSSIYIVTQQLITTHDSVKVAPKYQIHIGRFLSDS